jgi:hypothetical protein
MESDKLLKGLDRSIPPPAHPGEQEDWTKQYGIRSVLTFPARILTSNFTRTKQRNDHWSASCMSGLSGIRPAGTSRASTTLSPPSGRSSWACILVTIISNLVWIPGSFPSQFWMLSKQTPSGVSRNCLMAYRITTSLRSPAFSDRWQRCATLQQGLTPAYRNTSKMKV